MVEAQKRLNLVILNEHRDDIILTIKSLKNSSVLFNGVREIVKYEIKKLKG